jgi:hypothetical protein
LENRVELETIINVLNIFQLLIQSPSQGGRAILHLKTVRFLDDPFYGPNILGVNTFMDIQRTFDVVVNKTINLQTHMQRDSIYVDFGYISSAGREGHRVLPCPWPIRLVRLNITFGICWRLSQ